MNEIIQLTNWEILLVAQAGIQRQVENLQKRRKPAHGADDQSDWQKAIEGCLGEFAVAKHFGLFWSGKGKLGAADVGIANLSGVDVRTCQLPTGCLILHPTDDDDRQYWLVTGVNGKYTLRGWMWGRDGKDQIYWGDVARCGRPAFFVPQEDLNQTSLEPAHA